MKEKLILIGTVKDVQKAMGRWRALAAVPSAAASPLDMLMAARYGAQGTGDREQGEGSREKGEGSREKGVGSREKGEGSREQGEGSREQGEGRRE